MEPDVNVTTQPGFEFSEEQNKTIKSLSSDMRWVGAVFLVVGALACLGGVLTLAKGGLGNLLQGIILIVFAVNKWRPSGAKASGWLAGTGPLKSKVRLPLAASSKTRLPAGLALLVGGTQIGGPANTCPAMLHCGCSRTVPRV